MLTEQTAENNMPELKVVDAQSKWRNLQSTETRLRYYSEVHVLRCPSSLHPIRLWWPKCVAVSTISQKDKKFLLFNSKYKITINFSCTQRGVWRCTLWAFDWFFEHRDGGAWSCVACAICVRICRWRWTEPSCGFSVALARRVRFVYDESLPCVTHACVGKSTGML